MDDLDILSAGVEDFEHVLIVDEKGKQRLEVDFRFGIDGSGFLGARDLDQAKVGPIGVLAHELRVHGDKRLLGEAVDERFEVVRPGDQGMDTHESCAAHSPALAG